jgi:hypothetical protein
MRKRLLLILAFGLLLAQLAVIASSVMCRCCPCSTPDDDCPQGCGMCLSASMSRIVVPSDTSVRTLSPLGSVLPSPVQPRRAADPREIFHVPRPSAA